ncbi:MAG: Rrf2 family transcriptional regulator [Acidobacteria bacterium]|nr:Rrf2 family transcriptional regulator [Acidobacteriota bacterium]
MAGNTRLATAIHVAGLLSFADTVPISSENIADSVNTNPVVIRRIIGLLTKAGLVNVKMGVGGGACLAKSPVEVTLADIYLALEENAVFEVPQLEESHPCAIGRIVRPVLSEVLSGVEQNLLESLRKITLAEVIIKVHSRMKEQGILGQK